MGEKGQSKGYGSWNPPDSRRDPQTLNVLWAPPPDVPALFPCVDCGLITGNFCDGGITVEFDHCFAALRVPHDYSGLGGIGTQRTPLCSYCETCFRFCRFCRQISGCTPPTTDSHWSGVSQELSRSFDATEARLAIAREIANKRNVKTPSASIGQEDSLEPAIAPKSPTVDRPVPPPQSVTPFGQPL